MRNLGPRSWEMLAKAGVTSEGEIRRLGAVATYLAVLRAGQPATLNLLWSLAAGLEDRDWRSLTPAEKAFLTNEVGF